MAPVSNDCSRLLHFLDGPCPVSSVNFQKLPSPSSTTGRYSLFAYPPWDARLGSPSVRNLLASGIVHHRSRHSQNITCSESGSMYEPALSFEPLATVPFSSNRLGYYNPMPLPNSGTIGFLQSFLCNTNVSCRWKPFDFQTSSLRNQWVVERTRRDWTTRSILF